MTSAAGSTMRAAVAVRQNLDDPLAGLEVRAVTPPADRPGWTRIHLRAASLNPHDLWTLRGVGHPAERIPIILGCDGSGVTDDGAEVLLYPLLGDADRGGGDLTVDPQRALLSETIDGTLAEQILVPDSCVVPKPGWLTFEQAATLGVVWGTAFRMLFSRAHLQAGQRVLVQGASGGVASAAISLAAAAGARVYATARTEEKRAYALECGAYAAFEPGARLPERVDIVIETVGEATWSHSMRAVRPGGAIVVAGATSGALPPADLQRVFYQQISVIGSTGSTRPELDALIRLMESTGLRPHIDSVLPFDQVAEGYQRLLDGDVRGKIVIAIP